MDQNRIWTRDHKFRREIGAKIEFSKQVHHVRINFFQHFSEPKKGLPCIWSGKLWFLRKLFSTCPTAKRCWCNACQFASGFIILTGATNATFLLSFEKKCLKKHKLCLGIRNWSKLGLAGNISGEFSTSKWYQLTDHYWVDEIQDSRISNFRAKVDLKPGL